MDGQTGNSKNKYAHLDRLSTEALEELLRADIESPDDDDDEAILHILEVIEQREKEKPTGRLSDVDQAWADFQKHYNTPEGEGLSLYPDDEDADATRPVLQIVKETTAIKTSRFRVRRVLIAAAVVACLVVFAMPPALGYQNFFQMIGQWTESVFRFGPNTNAPTPTQNSGAVSGTEHTGEYESLQAALDDYDIIEKVAPSYFPDGFKLTDVTAKEFPEFHTVDFHAFYENNAGKSISISITQRDTIDTSAYEKDSGDVVPYTVGDVAHYIFENNGRTVSTWYVGRLECSIRADLSLTEIEKMVDSIYER